MAQTTILHYWDMWEISQTCVSTNGMTSATFVNKPKGFYSTEKCLEEYLAQRRLMGTRWHSGCSNKTVEYTMQNVTTPQGRLYTLSNVSKEA